VSVIQFVVEFLFDGGRNIGIRLVRSVRHDPYQSDDVTFRASSSSSSNQVLRLLVVLKAIGQLNDPL
jgi:hypothetical protein